MSILDDAIRDLRLHRASLTSCITRLRAEADEFENELGRVDAALEALGVEPQVPAPISSFVTSIESKVAERSRETAERAGEILDPAPPKRPNVNDRIGVPSLRQKVTACRFGCGYSKDWRPAVLRHETGCKLRPSVETERVETVDVGPVTVAPRPAPLTPAQFTKALTAPRSLPDGKVLACTERGCGHEAGNVRDLITHTTTVHARAPYDEEKFPVARSTS